MHLLNLTWLSLPLCQKDGAFNRLEPSKKLFHHSPLISSSEQVEHTAMQANRNKGAALGQTRLSADVLQFPRVEWLRHCALCYQSASDPKTLQAVPQRADPGLFPVELASLMPWKFADHDNNKLKQQCGGFFGATVCVCQVTN